MQYRYATKICNADMQYRCENTDLQERDAIHICNTDNKTEAVRGSDATVCSRNAIKNAIKKCINHMHNKICIADIRGTHAVIYAIQICNADMQCRYETQICNTDMQYGYALQICNTDMQHTYVIQIYNTDMQ